MIYKKVQLDLNDENIFLEVFASKQLGSFVRDVMLVIPGGGYSMICSDREGEPIALDFLQKGMATFVLRYSVSEKAKFPRPLIEASKAIKHIKDNAKTYGINPNRVFVTGFSAGGHLAASLGTLWHLKEIYEEIHMPYGYNKPTGILPIYPVISANVPTHMPSFQNITGNENPNHEELAMYSLETRVDENSAPAFICHTSVDTTVPPYNALAFAKAYADANMPFELHIFKDLNHGMALASKVTACGYKELINESCASWTNLAMLWMDGIK